MTEVSQRYGRLADAFAAKITAVREDRWTSLTPCEGWTAHDLVGHVVDTQGMIIGLVGRTLGDIPSTDTDPAAAFAAARNVVQRDLETPEVANTEFTGFMGVMTLETAVDRFLCFDLVVHGWDLARAAGLDDRIDPEDVTRVRALAESYGDALRSPGAFGPPVAAPDGGDDQAQLLAFLGRRP